MKKCVADWRTYLQITSKKIKKLEHEVFSKPFDVLSTKDYTESKEKYDKKETELKNKLESLYALKNNFDKVRDAVQHYNATKTIMVCGQEMTVATALEKWSNRFEEREKINKIASILESIDREERSKKNFYESEVNRLTATLVNGTRAATNAEKELIENRCNDLKPVVLDYLYIKEMYEQRVDFADEFEETVNTKINISNATTELEIELN